MKDKTTALILSALLGGLGVDRFYLGYTGMGVLKLLTGGVFGVLWIIDIINIANGKLQPKDGSGYASENFGATSKPATTMNDPYEELKKILHHSGGLHNKSFLAFRLGGRSQPLFCFGRCSLPLSGFIILVVLGNPASYDEVFFLFFNVLG